MKIRFCLLVLVILAFSSSLALASGGNYTAILVNASVSSPVHLGDFVRAQVRIMNTLNYSLDKQDCAVAAYDSSGQLVFDYATQCRGGDTYLDSFGNYVTFSNCSLSDSLGYYRFIGPITRDQGFIYAGNYTLRITCNGLSADLPFYVDLGKSSWDFNELLAFVVRRGGEIVFWIGAALTALLGLALVVAVIYKSRKKGGR